MRKTTGSMMVLLALWLMPLPALAATASLQAPAEAPAGGKVTVAWKGPGDAQDFISIDESGADDRKYGPYEYASRGNPVQIQVPDHPGEYVIRYHLAAGYVVAATAPLKVTAVAATLNPSPTIAVGGELAVDWTGPNQSGDFISIDPAAAAETAYGPYIYATIGSPAKIRAPEAAGSYLVRYHMANSYRVIGSAPVQVTDSGATLVGPEHVAAGADVLFKWTGPGHAADFISIDAVGSDDKKYGNYTTATNANPAKIHAPEQAGNYLVRYHLAESYRVIGSAPLRVDPITATLNAPAEVVAGTVFEVAWTGPDNEGDFITLVSPGTADRQYGASNGYTRRGNPARLEAPLEVGSYELRYLTGQGYNTVAKAPLRVTPGAAVGRLKVVSDSTQLVGSFSAVEFVVDASGSMLQRIGGERRIELAKNALVGLTDVLPADTGFALRVFGHKEADSCRTDLEIPLAKIDKTTAVAKIRTITAMNLAKTPIGASLLKVKEDLGAVKGRALIVLMTDGEETCAGDPKAAIESLRAAGLDVRVNIVGFAIDEVALKETFVLWARAGNGAFFDAQNGEQLQRAVRATLQPTYEVVRDGQVIVTSTVNADAINLPVGKYVVRLQGSEAKELGQPQIQSAQTTELRF